MLRVEATYVSMNYNSYEQIFILIFNMIMKINRCYSNTD